MTKNRIKTFLIAILCLFTLSCSFIVEDKGDMAINIPSYRTGGETSLSYTICLKDCNDNIVYYDTTVEKSVLITDLLEGNYTLEIYASDNQYNYTGYDVDINIKANQTTKSKVKMEKTPIGHDIPKPEYKNRGTLVIGFNNVITENNDVPVSFDIVNDKNQVIKTMEGKLGDFFRPVVPFGVYTFTVRCENYIYDNKDSITVNQTGETFADLFLKPTTENPLP